MIKYNYAPKKATTMQIDFNKLKDEYCKIRDEFISFRKKYQTEHPANEKENDPRNLILANPIQLITIQRTNLELLEKSLLTDEFWRLNSDKTLTKESNIKHHDMYFRFSFFILIIAHFESNLRRIESLIKDSEDNQSIRPTSKVYKYIISTLKISDEKKDELLNFLDLIFTLRNAIHNNAIFHPNDKKDKTITYKGKNYEFKVGESILNYGFQETLIFIQELFELIKLILSDDKINSTTFNPK